MPGFPPAGPHAAAPFVRNHSPHLLPHFCGDLLSHGAGQFSVGAGAVDCSRTVSGVRTSSRVPALSEAPAGSGSAGPTGWPHTPRPLRKAVPARKRGRQRRAGLVLQNCLPGATAWVRFLLQLHRATAHPEPGDSTPSPLTVLEAGGHTPPQWAQNTRHPLPGAGGCSPHPSAPEAGSHSAFPPLSQRPQPRPRPPSPRPAPS